jgi:pimeloyl-ACP methyl ester carboxylesterase
MPARSEFLFSACTYLAALSRAPADAEQFGIVAPADGATVIFVHGAWADGNSWSKVIVPLAGRGVGVIAAPIPLTSLGDDVTALERVIDRTAGPVVLVSHAYAGAVISSARNSRVKALVFINSLVPDGGETVADVFYRKPPHPRAPHLMPDANGYIWMPNDAFATAFAPNASPSELTVLAATQRPIAVACIKERLTAPTWRSTPSWYLVAEQDQLIDVDTQKFMAARIGATARSYPVDHSALITAPEDVVDIVSEAVGSIGKSPNT